MKQGGILNLMNKEMKVFYESKLAKCLLLPGYSSITLGCFVFTKKSEAEMEQRVLNHEAIHVRQWEEVTIASLVLVFSLVIFGLSPAWLLMAPFLYYVLYVTEYLIYLGYWLWKGIKGTSYRSAHHAAYRTICFEAEAYGNQEIAGYLEVRNWFEMLRYIKPIK